jgi:hypothetical protein
MTIAPVDGPAVAWIAGTDVQSMPGCSGYETAVLNEAAAVASEVIYRLSGKQWTGPTGPVTVRPLCRPSDMGERGWGNANMGMGIISWGMCNGMTAGANVASHFGHSQPREVDLGVFPVIEVTQVLIDGVTIPSDEYELQDYRRLVRMLPTENATPTEMYGWPTAQRLDLPDTEVGTFSVTYMYGYSPPPGGVLAAKVYGQYIAKSISGDPNVLPIRTTSTTRQGVSTATVDVEDIVARGLTGIKIVDDWIGSVNPGKQKFKAQVYSPDVGRARRLPRGTS